VAIDGVAPRAKMNQQRSRRFKAARDLEESRAQAVARGEDLPKDEVFDSNCITPGTKFMAEISENLKFLLRKRVKEDPSWQGLKVILSGHERPGEGEHKIVEFIRAMKLSSKAREAGFVGPETRHCMAGLDADLIMLALATHEPHFTLLREKVDFMAFKKAGAVGQTKTNTRLTGGKEFQLLHIGLLREYLEADMKPLQFTTGGALTAAPSGVINAEALVQASKDAHEEHSMAAGAAGSSTFTAKDYDGERVIDDFILLTALCGNDFLPHLPSLDIGEGALDTLLALYRTHLVSWGGYLSDSGLIHWERFQKLLKVVGKMESSVFQARADEAAKFAAKQRRAKKKLGGESVGGLATGALLGVGEEEDSDEEDADEASNDKELLNLDDSLIPASAKAAAEEEVMRRTAERLKKETMAVIRDELYPPGSAAPIDASPRGGAGVNEDEKVIVLPAGPDGGEVEVKEAPRPPSPYLLQAAAEASATADLALTFKTRYYMEKLGITYRQGSSEDDRILGRLIHSYAEALQWVLLYYYRGVPSWGWFFPFHYAPMTSDLADEVVKKDDKTGEVKVVQIAFRLGQPFKPFQQLLGCLPAASAKFLPQCYRDLMTREDSPLIHFYPDVQTIRLDQNGKRNPWEAVTLIPFIQENVMLEAIAKYCDDSKLTEEERRRNSFGSDWIIESDPTNTETLVSPMPITREQPNGYIDIMACGTRMTPFKVETPAVLMSTASASPLAGSGDLSSLNTSLITVSQEAMKETAHFYRARPHPEAIVPAIGYPTLHTVKFSHYQQAVR
jgi:5'-3' exoribonuclease 1